MWQCNVTVVRCTSDAHTQNHSISFIHPNVSISLNKIYEKNTTIRLCSSTYVPYRSILRSDGVCVWRTFTVNRWERAIHNLHNTFFYIYPPVVIVDLAMKIQFYLRRRNNIFEWPIQNQFPRILLDRFHSSNSFNKKHFDKNTDFVRSFFNRFPLLFFHTFSTVDIDARTHNCILI